VQSSSRSQNGARKKRRRLPAIGHLESRTGEGGGEGLPRQRGGDTKKAKPVPSNLTKLNRIGGRGGRKRKTIRRRKGNQKHTHQHIDYKDLFLIPRIAKKSSGDKKRAKDQLGKKVN